MKVTKIGMIHEYNTDGSFDYTGHVEALLVALETLDPVAGGELRIRFEAVRPPRIVIGDDVNKVNKAIREKLSAYAPDDMFFGNVRPNSNIVGYWPKAWINEAPCNSEVRSVGRCQFSFEQKDLNQVIQAIEQLMDAEESKGAESGLTYETLESLKDEALEGGDGALVNLPEFKQALLNYALDQYYGAA